MTRQGQWLWIWGAGLVLAGCSENATSAGGAPVDTGTDSGSGGSASPPDAAPDASRPDAPVGGSTGAAGSGGTGPEGGAGGAPGSGGPRDGGDYGTPPPYCVAPCVWEVVKDCIPALDSCVTEEGVGPGGVGTLTCDRESGWRVLEQRVGIRSASFEVSRGGDRCFDWSIYLDRSYPTGALHGRSSAVVAMHFYSMNTVYCGEVTLPPTATGDGGAYFADGGVLPMYELEPDRPECAPWDSRTGLPVSVTVCRSTRAGTCPVVDPGPDGG